MPINFLFVGATQLLLFLVVIAFRHLNITHVVPILLRAWFLGVPFGLCFDFIVGRGVSIFSYNGEPGHLFFVLNGFFSYGTAIATAWAMPFQLKRLSNISSEFRLLILAISLSILGLIGVLYSAPFPLLQLFFAGGCILFAGESTCMSFGRVGPIIGAILTNRKALVNLIMSSACVGFIYELANFLFPIWQWHINTILPYWMGESLIVSFGYFVLLHAMLIFARFLLPQPSESRQ